MKYAGSIMPEDLCIHSRIPQWQRRKANSFRSNRESTYGRLVSEDDSAGELWLTLAAGKQGAKMRRDQ